MGVAPLCNRLLRPSMAKPTRGLKDKTNGTAYFLSTVREEGVPMRRTSVLRIWVLAVSIVAGSLFASYGAEESRLLKVGDSMPTLSLPDIKGRLVKTSSFRGKVLVIQIFAHW